MTTATSAPLVDNVDAVLGRLLDLIHSAKLDLELLGRAGLKDVETAELRTRVANWLYANWYSVPDSLAVQEPEPKDSTNMAREFRTVLASCNLWERGWVVMQSGGDGSCVAGRGGVTRLFHAGTYANLSRPCAPILPGDNVAVMKPICWIQPETAFWCIESLGGPPAHPLVRLYWSVGYERIGLVLKELVCTLDQVAMKYSLKCPSSASGYARVDALIVYLEAKAWSKCLPSIRKLGRKLYPHLRKSIPPLTLKLAPGIAFAENGSAPESFGQARCSALADGVLAILARGPASRKEGLALLVESLRRNGINPKKPWLAQAK